MSQLKEEFLAQTTEAERKAKEDALNARIQQAKDSGAYQVLLSLERFMKKKQMRVKDLFSLF